MIHAELRPVFLWLCWTDVLCVTANGFCSQDVVRELDVTPGRGRVGVVTYSTQARKMIDVGQYTDTHSLSNAIDQVTQASW